MMNENSPAIADAIIFASLLFGILVAITILIWLYKITRKTWKWKIIVFSITLIVSIIFGIYYGRYSIDFNSKKSKKISLNQIELGASIDEVRFKIGEENLTFNSDSMLIIKHRYFFKYYGYDEIPYYTLTFKNGVLVGSYIDEWNTDDSDWKNGYTINNINYIGWSLESITDNFGTADEIWTTKNNKRKYHVYREKQIYFIYSQGYAVIGFGLCNSDYWSPMQALAKQK